MIQIVFKSYISKSGNSKVITVPSYYIKAGLIDVNKKYSVKLEELKKNAK